VGCRGLVLVQPRRVQAALGALGSRASTTPSGAILGANRELCDLRAVHGRPAGLAAQTLEPHPLPVDEQVNRQVPPSGATRAATALASCVSKYASGSASVSIYARRDLWSRGDGPERSSGVAGDLGAVPAGRMDPRVLMGSCRARVADLRPLPAPVGSRSTPDARDTCARHCGCRADRSR
jgi:hypothetical protein